ncbi:hypothetical protein [Streptomyces tropicalis]|uniref:Uncharacterized protein n=1 Tax=Streptomyces tropicalis TaxID=3034234 RepID=A0ABT6ABS7_9ACTN|nr:hypothetical protein [Streptomyces tropicalis]MDF3302101.1 hypothetical protein [Streptomyces tropicalis]
MRKSPAEPDDVPWPTHAHGPAEAVPRPTRALHEGDGEVADGALRPLDDPPPSGEDRPDGELRALARSSPAPDRPAGPGPGPAAGTHAVTPVGRPQEDTP